MVFISSNAPVSESMINPRTTISLGTSGWVLMVSTVLRTEGCREQFGKSGVHTRQYRQFLVGVLVGDILLVAFV